MTSEYGRPVEFESAFQTAYLQAAVKRHLTGGRKAYLRDAYARVLWFQRADAVSRAVRAAALAER